MSRKDYIKFAAMLAGERALAESIGDDGAVRQVEAITYSLADILAQDNPGFNRQRFYDASGIVS